jgi:tripartite-type tricarboxylate transporter receptor subunit TctC
MSTRLLAAVMAAVSTICASAAAQVYPSRPITLIVPYPAGGVTDGLARMLGEHMRSSLKQPIIVENVSGAVGNIATGRAVRAAPDGYTAIMGNMETHVVNAATHTLQYDVINDFEPVALLPSYPFLIVSKNAVPAKDLQELVAWIKTNADKVSQGTVGTGTTQHLCGIYMQNTIGVRWQFVPYRGGAPAMQDMLAGQFDLMCTASGSFLPLVRNNQIRAYAVTAKTRLGGAPDIPTVDEAGMPGMYLSVWNAIFVPKGTPNDAIAKLNAATVDALADPNIRQRVIEMGLDIPPREQQTPEALGAFQKAETEKWWPIVKAANFKSE